MKSREFRSNTVCLNLENTGKSREVVKQGKGVMEFVFGECHSDGSVVDGLVGQDWRQKDLRAYCRRQ